MISIILYYLLLYRSLTNEEVDNLQFKVRYALQDQLKVELRLKLIF
jgi:phenylalanyl-tRNA synthetase beta subunit